MSSGIRHHIDLVEPRPGYRLLVRWTGGGESLVDLSDDVLNGPVWAPLRDERLFARVRVASNGRVIEWPEPTWHGDPAIDVDGDGLWFKAQEQNLPVAAE